MPASKKAAPSPTLALRDRIEKFRLKIISARDALVEQLDGDDMRTAVSERLDAVNNSLSEMNASPAEIRRQWSEATRSLRATVNDLADNATGSANATLQQTIKSLNDLREEAIDAALDGGFDPTPRLPFIPANNASMIATMPHENDRGWHPKHLLSLFSFRVIACAAYGSTCLFIDVVIQVLVQHYTNRVFGHDSSSTEGLASDGHLPHRTGPPPPPTAPTGCNLSSTIAGLESSCTDGSLRQPAAVLDDLGFVALDWLGLAHKGHVADAFVYTTVVLAALTIVPTARGATVVCRWMLLLGSLFLLRGLSIGVTLLPNPLATCRTDVLFAEHVGSIDLHRPLDLLSDSVALREIIFHSVRVVSLQDVTCADVLYSGHTVCASLGALFAMSFASAASRSLLVVTLLRGLFMALLVAVPMVIVATRLHYTCDVLLGFVLTILSFKLYHTRLALAASCPMSFPLLRRIESLDAGACKSHEHRAR